MYESQWRCLNRGFGQGKSLRHGVPRRSLVLLVLMPGARSRVRLQPQAPAALCLEPSDAACLGEIAHAKNSALPLGHRNHPARVEQIENMRRLDALIVGWQRQQMAIALVSAGEERAARGFRILEMLEQNGGIRGFEIIA